MAPVRTTTKITYHQKLSNLHSNASKLTPTHFPNDTNCLISTHKAKTYKAYPIKCFESLAPSEQQNQEPQNLIMLSLSTNDHFIVLIKHRLPKLNKINLIE